MSQNFARENEKHYILVFNPSCYHNLLAAFDTDGLGVKNTNVIFCTKNSQVVKRHTVKSDEEKMFLTMQWVPVLKMPHFSQARHL